MIIPKPSQDEIDARFDLAVKLHKEHLLSKTGEMYPFNPDNLQEAIAEMSEEQKVTLAAYCEIANESENEETFNFSASRLACYILPVITYYWADCADNKSLEVVQTNFDPLNMR